MSDFDWDATTEARSKAGSAIKQGTCLSCERPMYQEPPYPGVPSEWRHRSSGHAVSYSPDKHLAGPTVLRRHQHRFEVIRDGVEACAVQGCDSEVVPVIHVAERTDLLTERERKTRESRMRGASAGKRRALGAGPGF